MNADSGPIDHADDDDLSLDEPIEALMRDHQLARRLFGEYFCSADEATRRTIGRRLLLLLETHSVLEENVFYWRAHAADPALVDRCEHEHDQVDRLIGRLQGGMDDDPDMQRLDRMVHRLSELVLAHIAIEERELFPQVRDSGIDLDTIAREMQAFETMLIASRMHDAKPSPMQAPQRTMIINKFC